MSGIATTPVPGTPKSISSQLAGLRRKVLTWLLVDGLSKVLLLLVGIIAFDLLIDWMFQLDLAQRIIMLGLILVGLGVAKFFWILRPLLHRPNDDALCLQVEERNRELSQVIISSLQFSRSGSIPSDGISIDMVAATIEQGARAAEGVDFGNTLKGNRFLVNLSILAASSLVLLGIGVGIAQGVTFLDIWFNRNVLMGDKEWPRNTYLEIEGVTDGQIVLTRGDDHNQIVIISKESKVYPETVEIEFLDGDARSFEEMTPTTRLEGREFALLFENVSSPFQFRAVAGKDGRTDWVQVVLVDPPAVDELELMVIPPAYTNLEDYALPSESGPYSVYVGSGLRLTGTTNKPLQSANLKFGGKTVPLEMASDTEFSLEISSDDLESGIYEFDFVDTTGLTASRPDTFEMRIKQDRVPRVLVRTKGVSGMVTERCRIPLEATATDDFAVTHMKLIYEWRGVQFNSVPQNGDVEFRGLDGFYGESEVPLRDMLDLELIKVPAGAGLKFSLVALDNDDVSGPNQGQSAEIPVRVVTEAELRADLLRREKEQRQELERIRKTQEDLLIEITAMLADVRSEQDPLESLAPAMRGDLLEAMRAQRVIGTNVATIAKTFESFLEEVINNRIDEETGAVRDRLETQIRIPLNDIDEFYVQDAVRGIEASRRSLEDAAQLSVELEATMESQRQVLRLIDGVLDAMVKAEGYQEALNLLNELKRAEEEVHRLTKQRRQQRLQQLLEQGGGDTGSDDSDDSDSNDDNSNDDDSGSDSSDDDSSDDDGTDDQ